jgi:hypothetical protein
MPYFSFSWPASARPPPRQRFIAEPPRRQRTLTACSRSPRPGPAHREGGGMGPRGPRGAPGLVGDERAAARAGPPLRLPPADDALPTTFSSPPLGGAPVREGDAVPVERAVARWAASCHASYQCSRGAFWSDPVCCKLGARVRAERASVVGENGNARTAIQWCSTTPSPPLATAASPNRLVANPAPAARSRSPAPGPFSSRRGRSGSSGPRVVSCSRPWWRRAGGGSRGSGGWPVFGRRRSSCDATT